jgi:adenine C2-methylase RlmN of 23S rRNA A2503 and tRNA A37
MDNKLDCLGVFKDHSDGTLKTVFSIDNNQIIEVTLLMNKNYDVVCVPTHHFCCLGCKMCHLTNKGLNKQMKPINIDNFIEALIRGVTTKDGNRRTNKNKLLISFMGVGEPLMNLSLIINVFKSEDEIKRVLGYDQVGYAIATMMPNKNIVQLQKLVVENNMPLKIHFSLHSPINEKRFDLIPSSCVYVEEALQYLTDYKNAISKNETIMNGFRNVHQSNDLVEIHYTLINGINDTHIELEKICELLNKYPISIKFIKFNPIYELKQSVNEKEWVCTLQSNVKNINIKLYTPPGRQIGSSCGEFTKHYYHQEIENEKELSEFLEWKKEHEIFD